MVMVCPKCRSKVVTITGYPYETVDCGNCGTGIRVPKESEVPGGAASQLAGGPGAKKSWWRRLFG
jgi:hypothetical protein